MWMSMLQAGIPLGIMLGYALGGAITNAGAAWQTNLFIQVAGSFRPSTSSASRSLPPPPSPPLPPLPPEDDQPMLL